MQNNLDLLKGITSLLCNVKVKEPEFDETVVNSEEFQVLRSIIMDLRELSSALNKGDLSMPIYNKGYVLANLKSLQANLRHLTWQTQKIAEGDFSQSVDFMGEFSDSFNKMNNKLKETNGKLLELASMDTLTHLPNRRSMKRFLDKIFSKYTDICILMMDIDHFKNVNDTFGHDIGDEVLVHISNILSQQLRSSDFIVRYGGEEFVAILPNTTISVAESIAARILTAVRDKPFVTLSFCINLTISIGLSCKFNDNESHHDILKRSDMALYKAKTTGRNKYAIYDL